MITCWYKNISMANYSGNLVSSLKDYPLVSVKVISAHCICLPKYAGMKDILEDRSCQFSSFPPFIFMVPNNRVTRIVYLFIQIAQNLLRGLVFLSKCKGLDIIHFQQSSDFSFGILPFASIVLVPTSSKKIVTAHNLYGFATSRLTKFVYNRADAVIVHSIDMQRTLMALGVQGSKIKIVPHGAKIPELMYVKRNKITFFGAPVAEKGVFVLFEALRILKKRGEKIKVHFYGIYSTSQKETADAQAKELKVDDCMIWGGRLSESEFDAKMQESLMTLAVYTVPVSGSSIITRAMSNGTPIIASKIGAASEYLEDVGLKIPPNDPQALADAILELKNNPDLSMQLGEKARKQAWQISWNVVARRTLDTYRSVLEHGVE